jgi:uncharacterized protein (TIGR02145 family)
MKCKSIFISSIIVFCSIFLFGCKSDEVAKPVITAPVIKIAVLDFVSTTKAFCHGYVTNDGGEKTTNEGICWSIGSTPTITDNKANYETSLFNSKSNITGLQANTTYYVRAYATNSAGTGYSEIKSFTTPSPVTDIDGNIYQTVVIGGKTWIMENLKTTKYRNGDPIQNVANETSWSKLVTGAYCNFNNDNNIANSYGKLYNWYAVNDNRKIAPEGWHTPTDAEWTTLFSVFGSYADLAIFIKEIGTTHWVSNINATNLTCFTALPGACRYSDGKFVTSDLGNSSYFWSSEESNADSAFYRSLLAGAGVITRATFGKTYGCSLRCVKD